MPGTISTVSRPKRRRRCAISRGEQTSPSMPQSTARKASRSTRCAMSSGRPIWCRSSPSRLVRTVTASSFGRGTCRRSAASFRRLRRRGQHRPAAGGMHRDEGRPQRHHRPNRPGHGVRNVVQLQVQKDRQAVRPDRPHPLRPVGAEELQPQLQPADLTGQAMSQVVGGLEGVGVDGTEDGVLGRLAHGIGFPGFGGRPSPDQTSSPEAQRVRLSGSAAPAIAAATSRPIRAPILKGRGRNTH